MRYVSTRGRAPAVGFADALLAGLAPDGGLYVPTETPELAGVTGSYLDVAAAIVGHFAGEDEAALVADAYASFDHPDVCPVVPLSDGLWVQELWHGPTLAFKDVA